jgi:hypothetical protein
MPIPTPHRFDNPLWEVGDILGWLIDHDPANFGRFLTAEDYEDYRSEHRRAVLYGKPLPLNENPTRTLLHWLIGGDLTVFDKQENKWLSEEDWYGKDERDVVRGIRRYVAKREEVLRLDQQKRNQKAAGADIASNPAQAEDGAGDLSSPPLPTASKAPVDLAKPGPKPEEKSPNAADASPIPVEFDRAPLIRISMSSRADAAEEAASAEPSIISRGKDLDAALDEWCRATFQGQELPGRSVLYKRATSKLEFRNATSEDMKRLRRDFASPRSKKGGAAFHEQRRSCIKMDK